ncbi:MAG: hypothetical protein Q8908_14460 [Bacteroidota bacterium]|nr:hypothetical protein [Bacteroidota bacterium]
MAFRTPGLLHGIVQKPTWCVSGQGVFIFMIAEFGTHGYVADNPMGSLRPDCLGSQVVGNRE